MKATRIVRIDDEIYQMILKVVKMKGVNFGEALKLLVTEKQDFPGLREEDVFNLGVLIEQHFIYQELLGTGYTCAICMEAARKKYPFLLNYERTKHCCLRNRDEIEKHFKEKHPDIVEMLDKGR